MLLLPMTADYFYMILEGKKPLEFRICKPYWTKRFSKVFAMQEDGITPKGEDSHTVWFRNGYSKKSPTFVAICHCLNEIKNGDDLPQSLGAVKGRRYYVLAVEKITETYNIDPNIKIFTERKL